MRHAGSVAAARYESWLERRMEQRLGIDTAGIDCDLARLGVARADLVHAYAYQPVQLRVFGRIIRASGGGGALPRAGPRPRVRRAYVARRDPREPQLRSVPGPAYTLNASRICCRAAGSSMVVRS